MSKPRLVKKEDIPADFHARKKNKKSRKPAPSMTTQAIKATAEWLNTRKDSPNARDAFAALILKNLATPVF